jgi:hypothetical protein
VPNPFYGQIGVGALATPTIAAAQLLRPYPQFDGVTSAVADWAPSIYHGLEVKLEKAYAKRFTVLASYTYSTLINFDRRFQWRDSGWSSDPGLEQPSGRIQSLLPKGGTNRSGRAASRPMDDLPSCLCGCIHIIQSIVDKQ